MQEIDGNMQEYVAYMQIFSKNLQCVRLKEKKNCSTVISTS